NPVEVVIDGTGFHDVASVELVTNTGLVAATAAQITVESSERIRARIDPQLVPGKAFEYLPGMPSFQGPLSVRVTNRNGTVGLLENAIQAVGEVGVFGSATAQFLRTNLVVPGVLYPNGVATLTVAYENTGVLPIPSPILELRLDDPAH